MQKIRNRIAQIVGCFVKDFECIQDKFSIKIYNMDSKTDMERLCDAIVDYF